MLKKLALLLLVVVFVSCHKNGQKVPVCAPQTCTEIFVTVGVGFTSANGSALAVKDFTAVNQRTKETLKPNTSHYDLMPGYYIIADDNMRAKFSTEGDNVLVTATHPTTGQIKTAMFKVSGGCNCHITKISGPETIAFDADK